MPTEETAMISAPHRSAALAASLLAVLLVPTRATAQDDDYFQQGVDYRIEARLDEERQVLEGRARLRYTNNSGASLDTLFVHQHLNAFRPNSAWARRELEFGNRRFQDLGPDDHGFERFTRVRVGDSDVRPVYPGAPDSTVAALPLPQPLRPGESVTVVMDWTARTSTTPRRQGRRGRHWDFAQWYPRIAVYDRGGWQEHPLMPQGEFYGEFASYDVTLDVAADQVIGATGVPVEGEPGWAAAAATPGQEIWYRRDFYGAAPAAESLGLLDGAPAADRKRVRWLAHDVHHFAWTTNPEYVYEGGRWDDIAIHVLYQPGDDDWDEGVAVQRTENALAFLDTIFGDFVYPQLTNVHRIESGGTEFPMLIMDGSASQGLIVHEVGHNYLHGILANNEWKEGWMDEGFQSFVDRLYAESTGASTEQVWAEMVRAVGENIERQALAQPIALQSAEFRDFQTYGAMTYTKPAIVFYMLRELVGHETMARALREYYDEYQLMHVRGVDFFDVVERVSGRELDWFYDQWITRAERLDYGIASATTRQAGGQWLTTVEVLRMGHAWMPVTLRVGETERVLESRDRRQVVQIRTSTRPDQAVLDPRTQLLDMDRSNDAAEVSVR